MTDYMDLEQSFSEAPPQKDARKWSEFQEAIFDFTANRRENLLIQAVAGSGKTTTILKAMEFTWGNQAFLAFNKAIADTLRSKTTSEVKTLNALGWKVYFQNASPTLDKNKVSKILQPLLGQQDFSDFGYTLSQVVGLAKNRAVGLPGCAPVEQESFESILEDFQFDVPEERIPELALKAMYAFKLSRANLQVADFNDQLYIPLDQGWIFPRFDTVFVDESQDLSPIQHLMLDALARQGCRIIAVGDRHQAIYAFRGADSDSMDTLKKGFRMEELPLSVTYRCPRRVVEAARRFCPSIEPRPGAPEGSCLWLDFQSGDKDPEFFPDQTLVVCRNNAPLFKAVLRYIRAGKPCQVLSNFIDSFTSFIRGFKAENMVELRTSLDQWFLKESEAAKAKGFMSKLAFLTDKYETSKILCDAHRTPEEMIRTVRNLGSGTVGPRFATVHKAKGLEDEDVFILRPDLMPAFYARSPEAKQQEANLQYVAITRAKSSLTFGTMPL